MINAIIQIPNRYQLGSILSGGKVAEKFISNQPVKLLSGRFIRIVPLTFYKFFSQWGQSFYEHIFATDEPFDPIALSQFMDSTTGLCSTNKIGSVLVPISMKKIGPNSVESFLFSKSINFLINYYQIGKPIAEIQFTDINIDPHRSIEVPDSLTGIHSGGVISYGDYRKIIFEDVLYSTYGTNKLPPDIEFALSHMTSERPATIENCLEELTYNYSSIDAVWSYIDELYQYETGEPIDPKEFFSEYNYRESVIDPLTLKCLRSPSYILLSSLRPYMNAQSMRRYGTIGFYPQVDEFTSNIVPLNFSDFHGSQLRYDMVESLMSIPEDGFTMHINWDSYVPDFYSMFGHNILYPAVESLHESVRQLFLNKWVNTDQVFNNVVVSKNWYDEVFISCKNDHEMITYYINLAWFHLISPSLINMSSVIRR